MLLAAWLSGVLGLPERVVLGMGLVNLCYAAYATWLVRRRSRRTIGELLLLAGANVAWAPVCLAVLVYFRDAVTVFGMAHLLAEGSFVLVLGFLEWRFRKTLVGVGYS